MPRNSPAIRTKILVLTLLLTLGGLVILFSASSLLGVQRHDSEFYFVSRQGMAAALGIGLMLVLSRVRYQVYGKVAPILLAIQILLTGITLVDSMSHSVQGVSRWILLGGFRFQPSELAKIIVPICFAFLLQQRKSPGIALKKILLYVVPIGFLLYLIYRQPDLGSVIILSAVMLGMLFIAGAKTGYLFGALGMGGMLFFIATLNSEYRRRRIAAFLNPWADPQGSGFQSIQSFLSFHSGHISGLGLGNGNSKLFYLPEVHTDFIFAMVGEEMGFIGSVALILAFGYMGYLLFKVSRIAPDPFGRLLAFGLSFCLMLQATINMAGVTGLIPVKGLPLPFISWGRSALLINLMMVGILLNIARQSSGVPSLPSYENYDLTPEENDDYNEE